MATEPDPQKPNEPEAIREMTPCEPKADLPILYELQRLRYDADGHGFLRDNAWLVRPPDAWCVQRWGWVRPKINRATVEDALASGGGHLSSIHAVERALHLAAIRCEPPPPDVLFYAARHLGAATRKGKPILAALTEAREAFLDLWPPPVPEVPLPANCIVISSIVEQASGAKCGSEYWRLDAPGALARPFHHPGVREAVITVMQAAGGWDPPAGKDLPQRALSARAGLEEYRLTAPFRYGKGEGECAHQWVKLEKSWQPVRRWICLACFGEYLCTCDASLYGAGESHYTWEGHPALQDLCPSCRGLPDLMPPSPNQLMYHSTMFDVVHQREAWRLEETAVGERMSELGEGPMQARLTLKEERGKHWARDATRLAHDFDIHDRWISETAMVQTIREAFPDEWVVREASPEWLGGQRLDAYLPGRKLAFEYHGRQHFEPVEFFGGVEAFEHRKELDKRKWELCQAHGVKLVVFVDGEHVSPDEVHRRARSPGPKG